MNPKYTKLSKKNRMMERKPYLYIFEEVQYFKGLLPTDGSTIFRCWTPHDCFHSSFMCQRMNSSQWQDNTVLLQGESYINGIRHIESHSVSPNKVTQLTSVVTCAEIISEVRGRTFIYYRHRNTRFCGSTKKVIYWMYWRSPIWFIVFLLVKKNKIKKDRGWKNTEML